MGFFLHLHSWNEFKTKRSKNIIFTVEGNGSLKISKESRTYAKFPSAFPFIILRTRYILNLQNTLRSLLYKNLITPTNK